MMRRALELTLPGEWHAMELGSDEAIAADVSAFVRARFGRRDDQATQRAQQRARLSDAARRARDAGASQFHVSLTAPGGAAFAATAAEYAPHLPLGAATDPAAVADSLVQVLAARSRSDAAADHDHWAVFAADGGAVFDRGDGLVLRTSRRLEPVDSADGIPTTVVDYWLTRPGRAEVVLITFTTALAELEPLMVELFDAIIGASPWEQPPSTLRAELGDRSRV